MRTIHLTTLMATGVLLASACLPAPPPTPVPNPPTTDPAPSSTTTSTGPDVTTTTASTTTTSTPPPTGTTTTTSTPPPTGTTTTTTPTTGTTTTTTEPEPEPTHELISNLKYGTHPHQSLDLFVPLDSGPHPLVVWAHGGFWVQGGKQEISSAFVAMLTQQGYAVATINYRLAGAPPLFAPPLQHPVNPSPAQVHDFKKAVRYLQQSAADWDLDGDTTFVSGHSAGGHLALLSGVSSRGTTDAGGDLSIDGGDPTIAGVFTFGAPADLPLTMATVGVVSESGVRSLMGCTAMGPCYTKPADPRYYLDADDIPVLLVSGADDLLVPESNAQSFARTADAVGYGQLVTHTEPDADHDEINSRFDSALITDWLHANTPTSPADDPPPE